jgi:hypothetical protein
MSAPTYNALDLRADRIRARRLPWTGRLRRRASTAAGAVVSR